MAETTDPWADLVAGANTQIREANKGNNLAAREVLRQAAIGLRDVLAGRLPDRERDEYLKYLLGALDQINAGAPPDKALGVWSASRPHAVADERDFALFLAVGQRLDRTPAGTEKPVTQAIKVVAARFNLGEETVRKTWIALGGEAAWTAARDD